eukprot:TRINITY_DN2505_c0_g1_i2.p1 TRINITY_DN2505_c0_g1~~TRINITY_DN2505_c0_g1_i2.p1  ORF type:complete len:454 (+),score=124.31 TRINITY_DN2505_c0_g1_i2:107-1363(+)
MLGDLVQSIFAPNEIYAMMKLKYESMQYERSLPLDAKTASSMNSRDFCYAVLNKVSRSFALVIQELPEELRHPICIFYLVLRGLDTVEDDMKISLETKLPLLHTFHEKISEPGFHLNGIGDGPYYPLLLEHFDKVVVEYNGLKDCYKKPICDITRKMGDGMAEFCQRKVVTEQDFDLYCHYVAGLVGIGLTQLFAGSGLEEPEVGTQLGLANSMGLFLQKTNIIRDYLEDVNEGRIFWPDSVWSRYASKIEDFRDIPNQNRTNCLNYLVNNALQHIPDVMDYMSKLKHPMVFRFCAIPQVMAIATLALCYNNDDVFCKVVKIRKGLSAKMMIQTCTMEDVRYWFRIFLDEIATKAAKTTEQSSKTNELIEKAYAAVGGRSLKGWSLTTKTIIASLVVVGVFAYTTGFNFFQISSTPRL